MVRCHLQPQNAILFKSSFSLFPVRHEHGKKGVELFGVIGVNQVAQLMNNHIFNTVSGRFQQLLIQCNDQLFWKTGTPTSVHGTDTKLRFCHTVFLKRWVGLI